MKVLELNFEKTWRGGERQTLYFLSGLSGQGVDTELLCREGFPLQRKAKKAGFRVHSFTNVFRVILFLIINGRKYDILHAETAQILTYCVLTKPFHGAKVACTRRVDFVPKGFFTKMKYKWTDLPIAISHAIKKILTDLTGKHITHISEVVVVKQLDKKRAAGVLLQKKVDTSKYIIGTVAAIEPHKDPLMMVEAIKKLSEERDDFVFIHLGDGSLAIQAKQKVKEYGLEEVYKFLGFQDAVEDFFSLLNVFVMSSEQEGLGSSVLDAFVYKVPVVATGAGGLKDLLEHDRGIITGIKQPQKLAAGISKMLDDKDFKNETTSRAYDYVLKHHSIDYIAQQYVNSFENLLSGG